MKTKLVIAVPLWLHCFDKGWDLGSESTANS
jgi:hypothetical protein